MTYTMTIEKDGFGVSPNGDTRSIKTTERMTGVPAALVTTWRRSFPSSVISVVAEEPAVKRSYSAPASSHSSPSPVSRDGGLRRPPAKPIGTGVPAFDLGALINEEVGD